MLKNMSPYHPKGLTVIELLVAIGILTLTVSLGALFLKAQLPGIRLYTAAHDLSATLNRARRLSVSEQIPYGVSFMLADKTYALVKFAPSPVALATSTLPLSTGFYSTTTPFTNNTARFNSFGGAAEAGELVLQNDQNQTKKIIINPSGYVRVE